MANGLFGIQKKTLQKKVQEQVAKRPADAKQQVKTVQAPGGGLFTGLEATGQKIAQEFQTGKQDRLLEERRARGEELLAGQAGEFQQARQGFSTGLQLALGQQLGAAQRRFEQQAGRRGLTGSGVEQAGLQAVSAAGQQQFAQSLAEFDTKLQLLQQQERSSFRVQEFDFLRNLSLMAERAALERDLLRFQAQLASDAASAQRFGQMLSVGSQIAGFAFGGPPGAAAAGAATSGFTGPVGPIPGGL